jgi:cytoskeletal protein RodZ
MDINTLLDGALRRITTFVNTNKGPYSHEELCVQFFGKTVEIDRAPTVKRKLDLSSQVEAKEEEKSSSVKKEVSKSDKSATATREDTNTTPESHVNHSSATEVTEQSAKRSTVENIPPKDDNQDQEAPKINMRWFDKTRKYVEDIDTNNILKLVNDEYILVGRVDRSSDRKTLIDVGPDEILRYKGTITTYEYDSNYFITNVKKATKPNKI